MVRRKRVQRAKTEATGSEYLLGDRGLHRGPTPSYAPFSEDNAKRIIDAAFELMSQTGIGFDPEPCLMDRLGDASFMEVATGAIGAPSQLALAEMAMCEISRVLGIQTNQRGLQLKW